MADQTSVAPISLSSEIGLVSDYRYRGLSLSDEQPAIQGGVTLTHQSGAYANLWASSIAEYGAGPTGDGAHTELDVSLGWSGDIAGLTIDAAAAHYGYPGGKDVAYWEFPATVSKTFGPATLAGQYAYAPSQTNLGGSANRYAAVDLTWADKAWPVELGLHLGQEKGAFAPDGKTDWSVSAAHALGPFNASAAYVSAHADGLPTDDAIIVGLTAGF